MISSGRTSEVRVTVPETDVSFPIVSVRRDRRGKMEGKLWSAIKYLFFSVCACVSFGELDSESSGWSSKRNDWRALRINGSNRT